MSPLTRVVPGEAGEPPGFEPIQTSWGPMFLRTSPTCDLGDGLTGFYVRPPTFACMQAAVATVLQVDQLDAVPEGVFEPGDFLMWAEENGIAVDFLTPGKGPHPVGLSIGVTRPVEQPLTTNVTNGQFGRHTIVLCDGRMFFDPTGGAMLWPNGAPPAPVQAGEIEFVITLTRRDQA